ncbi:MAG: hypothetical protein WC261_10195 [Synergistaceae bacterium]|jgi:plasmid stability protein
MKEKLVEMIVRKIPLKLRQEFKAKAAQEGKSMQQVMKELITKYVES